MHTPFILERLRVGLEQLVADADDLLSDLILPQYRDFVIETIQYINNKIIGTILQSSNAEIRSTFQNNLVPFALKFASLNAIILQSKQNNLSKLAELDQTFYDKILKIVREASSEIGEDASMKILEVIEKLADYENVLLGIVIKRPNQLAEALKEVDTEDLVGSVSGTMLGLACILAILKDEKRDGKKLKILLDLAGEHSETMESYADTIDIMSNPEEMELLKRSEQE